jgi:hypothetical protein
MKTAITNQSTTSTTTHTHEVTMNTKNSRRLSLATLFAGLPTELALLGRAYEQTSHPTLAAYPTLSSLLDRLTKGDRADVQKSEIVASIIVAHQTAPHRLWVAILLQAFAPMLTTMFKKLVGCDPEERLALLLASFQEAIRVVDAERDPTRIGSYVREATRKRVSVLLSKEREWARIHSGVDPDELIDEDAETRTLAVEWRKDLTERGWELLRQGAEHGRRPRLGKGES